MIYMRISRCESYSNLEWRLSTENELGQRFKKDTNPSTGTCLSTVTELEKKTSQVETAHFELSRAWHRACVRKHVQGHAYATS